MSRFANKDVISIEGFSREDILELCQVAEKMRQLEKTGQRYHFSDALKHKSLAYLFYEASTRTKMSHLTAMRELGGSYDGFSGTEGTSVMKKETIRDTVMMAEANHFDVVLMRHPLDGSTQWAADVLSVPLISGGDGKNEHPTQSLLDLFTIYSLNNNTLDNLTIGLGGDLAHGRTIRSLSLALSHFDNVTIRWAANDFFGMPKDLEEILTRRGVKVIREQTVRDVMKSSKFYYMTRPQTERMQKTPQEVEELIREYRIDLAKVDGFDVKLLHPMPVNSEIQEIEYPVYFSPAQAFFGQAEMGVFLRKALLYEMLAGQQYINFEGVLPQGLLSGNNRLQRGIHSPKKKGYIDNIAYGTVFDHLVEGAEEQIVAKLQLAKRRATLIPAHIFEEARTLLKSGIPVFTERELKQIVMLSPEPTVNYVDNGVRDKFVYLLCGNDNCVTRAITEDVPPKFYANGSQIKCHYCKRPYEVHNGLVTPEELKTFVSGLPKR